MCRTFVCEFRLKMAAFYVVCLVFVLVFGCGTAQSENVITPEMVDMINTSMDVKWKAVFYPQFANLDMNAARRMLGSYGAWPKNAPPKIVKTIEAEAIPDEFDSRKKWPDSIHPIRNQGNCGSCWAFGASEVLSDRFSIASQNQVDVVLSAQQLVDCDTVNTGCSGGWPIKAWQYMVSTGLLTEECYGEYIAKDQPCQFNGTIQTCPSGSGHARFYKAKDAYSVAVNVQAIQTDIMSNGPVEADFTVYQDFFSYGSGVYWHTSGQAVGGHAIKMLGWGTLNGVDYWLCANSWGSTWGMEGFFLIRRGTNECGIESGVTAGLADV